MTPLKTLVFVGALLAGGSSLAMAQNGPATGGERPVAGGANNGGGPAYGYGYRFHRHCMPTIGLTTAIGIGIIKTAASECAHRDSNWREPCLFDVGSAGAEVAHK